MKMGIIRLTIMSLCGTKSWPVRHLKSVHNITLFLSPTSWLNFSPACQVDVKPLTHYKPPNYFRPFFHSKDVKPKRTAIVSGNAECKNRTLAHQSSRRVDDPYRYAAGFLWMDENPQSKRSGHRRDIQIHSPSSIYRDISDYHRLDVSMAEPNPLDNVSDPANSLLQTCQKGRATGPERIWGSVFKI